GAQDDSDLTQHDRGSEFLEANALGTGGGTGAEVVINHLDLMPPEGACPLDEGILQALTFLIVQDLCGGGLPHVHQGLFRQVVGGNFGVTQHRRLPPLGVPKTPDTTWRVIAYEEERGIEDKKTELCRAPLVSSFTAIACVCQWRGSPETALTPAEQSCHDSP